MSYYRGDYYRGDYYRGDSIFSKIGNFAKGAIGGFITGGPGGALIGGTTAVLRGAVTRPSSTSSPVPAFSMGPGIPGQHPTPGIGGAISRILPGGSTGYTKNRRMNAGNAKAARRAIRRLKAVRHLLHSIEKEMPHRKCTRPHAKTSRR